MIRITVTRAHFVSYKKQSRIRGGLSVRIAIPPRHHAKRRPLPSKHLPQIADQTLRVLICRKVASILVLRLEHDVTNRVYPPIPPQSDMRSNDKTMSDEHTIVRLTGYELRGDSRSRRKVHLLWKVRHPNRDTVDIYRDNIRIPLTSHLVVYTDGSRRPSA